MSLDFKGLFALCLEACLLLQKLVCALCIVTTGSAVYHHTYCIADTLEQKALIKLLLHK